MGRRQLGGKLASLEAILRGSWGSMLAHDGSCRGHLASGGLKVGSKMAQDGFVLAQVGPMTPKMASKTLPSIPR